MEHNSGKIWIPVILGVVTALTCFILFLSGLFNVKSIDYDLNANIDPELIFELVGVKEGKSNLLLIREDSVKRRLLENPFVRSVTVTKKFPDTLLLDIQYFNDFACFHHSNLFVTVNEVGYVINIKETQSTKYVIENYPIKHYKVGEYLDILDKSLFESTLDLVSLVNQSQLNDLKEMSFDKGKVKLVFKSGLKANFGQLYDTEDQFNKFITVYENLVKKGNLSGIIDVSGKGLPTYRPFGD